MSINDPGFSDRGARTLLPMLLLVALCGVAAANDEPQKPAGYNTPAARCAVCHSLEKNGPLRVAPNLWGIVGAAKGRDRNVFAYSPALLRMGGTWTEEELDAFLADAGTFMPGTNKAIRVPDAAERREIIEYLKKLGD